MNTNRRHERLATPGVAVCIIKNGKVEIMKGYGVKEMGTTDSVDVNTLFMIGSNTHRTALAMLDADKNYH